LVAEITDRKQIDIGFKARIDAGLNITPELLRNYHGYNQDKMSTY
jgi:hypothetical protein